MASHLLPFHEAEIDQLIRRLRQPYKSLGLLVFEPRYMFTPSVHFLCGHSTGGDHRGPTDQSHATIDSAASISSMESMLSYSVSVLAARARVNTIQRVSPSAIIVACAITSLIEPFYSTPMPVVEFQVQSNLICVYRRPKRGPGACSIYISVPLITRFGEWAAFLLTSCPPALG
jgi:hypothetical protein